VSWKCKNSFAVRNVISNNNSFFPLLLWLSRFRHKEQRIQNAFLANWSSKIIVKLGKLFFTSRYLFFLFYFFCFFLVVYSYCHSETNFPSSLTLSESQFCFSLFSVISPFFSFRSLSISLSTFSFIPPSFVFISSSHSNGCPKFPPLFRTLSHSAFLVSCLFHFC